MPAKTQLEALQPTHRSWIYERLDAGPEGIDDVRRHVLSVFRAPLLAYARHVPLLRRQDDVEDVVHEFLQDRIFREGFFDSWRTSGRRLRDWMRTAMRFFLLERQRAGRKSALPGLDPSLLDARQTDPRQAFNQAYAQNIIALALEQAQASLAAGFEQHWQALELRFTDRLRYAQIGQALDVTAEQARSMVRQTSERVRRALRDLMRREGCEPWEIDEEIMALLADVGGGGRR